MCVDNIAQPGPFMAARDFLEQNPGWTECGGTMDAGSHRKPYDFQRSRIAGTDLLVLRVPQHQSIWRRPWSPGQTRRAGNRIEGVRLSVQSPREGGTLSMQVVLRGFGGQPAELVSGGTVEVAEPCDAVTVALDPAIQVTGHYTHFTVEPWLVWDSATPLRLSGPINFI
jgi:hypothetical protein